MAFVAEEVTVEMIRSLRGVLETIERRDRPLADQARRAAQSVALNLLEGSHRAGKDRIHCWRIAEGSAAELQMAMRIAVAWGYVDGVERVMALIDRTIRLLWGLTHSRGSAATASPSPDR